MFHCWFFVGLLVLLLVLSEIYVVLLVGLLRITGGIAGMIAGFVLWITGTVAGLYLLVQFQIAGPVTRGLLVCIRIIAGNTNIVFIARSVYYYYLLVY